VIEVPLEPRYPLSDNVFRALQPDLDRPPPPVHGRRLAAERAGFRIERAATVLHLRTDESRIPLGVPAKCLLYWPEERLQTAADIELWATR